jgi:hypothetical protein
MVFLTTDRSEQVPSVSLHDEANAEHLALVKGWLEHAKTVYIWDGA